MKKIIEKLKAWASTTLKEAIIDNWSELAATCLAFYGTAITEDNIIFSLSFYLFLVYWIYWRLLGGSKFFK